MNITAKVTCSMKSVSGEGPDRRASVSFLPDYADGRNKEWAAATPTLNLSMTLNGEAADQFDEGQAYTLTFSESEPSE